MHTTRLDFPGAARRILVPCLLILAACPSKDGLLTEFSPTAPCDSATSDGACEGSASATDPTTEPTGTSTSTGVTTDVSVTGTTGDPLCLDPSVPDEQIGPAVTVTIRNASDADVFVRGNGFCSDPAFSLRNAADEPLVSWIAASCPAMCGFVLANDECGCPDIGCTPGVLRIAPGGAFVDTWSGALYTFMYPEAGCVGEYCAGQMCSVQTQAEAGMYTITAHGDVGFTCEIGDCACEPNEDGWCRVPDSTIDPGNAVEATIAYPGTTQVELVFE